MTPATSPTARWLRASLLGAGVLWGAWSFSVEVLHTVTAPPPPLAAPPSHWTPRAAAVWELEDFLDPLDQGLPRSSRIAVGSHRLPASEDYFLSLWVSYFLPRHDVVRAIHRRSLEGADYLLLYRSSLGDFGAEATAAVFTDEPLLLEEHPAGTFYRIPRP